MIREVDAGQLGWDQGFLAPAKDFAPLGIPPREKSMYMHEQESTK
jgi:hypothetical protein